MQLINLCILCDIQNMNVIKEEGGGGSGSGGGEWISSQEGGGGGVVNLISSQDGGGGYGGGMCELTCSSEDLINSCQLSWYVTTYVIQLCWYSFCIFVCLITFICANFQKLKWLCICDFVTVQMLWCESLKECFTKHLVAFIGLHLFIFTWYITVKAFSETTYFPMGTK